MNRLLASAAALTLLTSAPAAAQKSPERIQLTDRSSDGAILIRVPVKPYEYTLQFSKDGSSGFLSRVYLMKVRSGPEGYRYIARTLSPGRYRLDSVWQQGSWSACLENGTIEVPVSAGRIAYLGTLGVDQVLQGIQNDAVIRGRTALGMGDFTVARPEDARPLVEGRDEAAVAEARTFAQDVMNGSGARLDVAPVSEVAFNTSAAGRAIKVCG